MINNSVLLNNGIETLLNTIPYDNIPIIANVKINNSNYGRVDIFINRYYYGNMAYLPLLLSFNKISDAVEMKLGMNFEIPDINYLLSQLEVNNILDENIIPGISKSMDNTEINFIKNKASGKTVASPKLKISLKKVTYDKETGIISY